MAGFYSAAVARNCSAVDRFIVPLDDLINWSVIHPWTRDVWKHDGKTYGVPQEVYTVDLEYNSALMEKLGITVPSRKQFSATDFLGVIKKSVDAGITPMAVGVGNRPYPGAFFTHELLLKQLGLADYGKLLKGEISYTDPRVMKVFDYVKQVADAKGFPSSFTTLTLGETFSYFAVKPGALMAPMGSFMVPNIANPPEKGGPPVGFPMSFMKFPLLDGAVCPNCKTAAVGASFAINATSKNQKLAAEFLQEMAKPEMGVLWLQNILLQTATITGDAKVTGPYAKYFEELLAVNADADVFVGLANDNLQGQCKDTFAQVVNTALPAGLISPADAAARLDQDCLKS